MSDGVDTARPVDTLDKGFYAGFWRRTAAVLIDYIGLGLAMFGLALVASDAFGVPIAPRLPIEVTVSVSGSGDFSTRAFFASGNEQIGSNALTFILLPVFWTVFEAMRTRGSPGKRIMGILVIGPEGRQLSWGRSIGRNFVKIFSFVLVLIGVLMVAFTRQKRSLHDLLLQTYVVRNNHPAVRAGDPDRLTKIFS